MTMTKIRENTTTIISHYNHIYFSLSYLQVVCDWGKWEGFDDQRARDCSYFQTITDISIRYVLPDAYTEFSLWLHRQE
jgi:hypothetical protein